MLNKLCHHFIQFAYNFMFRIRHGSRNEWSVSLSGGVVLLSKNERPYDSIRLSQVLRVRAVSKDMVTRDEIFLVFETNDKEYLIGEYFHGFDAFAEQLQSVLQLRVFDWYVELSKAAPFTNPEVLLWEK